MRPLEQSEQADAWGRFAGVVAGSQEGAVEAVQATNGPLGQSRSGEGVEHAGDDDEGKDADDLDEKSGTCR